MPYRLLIVGSLLIALGAYVCCERPSTPARGSLAISWSIAKLGRPATCAQVDADTVSVLLRNPAGVDTSFSFACSTSIGITPLFPADTYDVTLSLHADDGTTVAVAPTQFGIKIRDQRATTLAPSAFAIESQTGNLVLEIGALGLPRNCTSREFGGAGMTGYRLRVQGASGGCASMTFTRLRRGAFVGLYLANDCSLPAIDTCIEQDEVLMVHGITAVPYSVNVIGTRGTTGCWTSTDIARVPSGGTLTKTIQLAPTQQDGC